MDGKSRNLGTGTFKSGSWDSLSDSKCHLNFGCFTDWCQNCFPGKTALANNGIKSCTLIIFGFSIHRFWNLIDNMLGLVSCCHLLFSQASRLVLASNIICWLLTYEEQYSAQLLQ